MTDMIRMLLTCLVAPFIGFTVGIGAMLSIIGEGWAIYRAGRREVACSHE